MSTSGKIVWVFAIMGIILLGTILYATETCLKSFGVIKTHKRHKFSHINKKSINPEFKEMYDYIKQKYASELEKNRKTLIKATIVCLILFILASLLLLLYVKARNKFKGAGFLFVLPALYYIYQYKKCNKIYVQNFKNKIIKNFVKHINSNLEYNQNGGKNLEDYYFDGQFEDGKFNNFETDDYIKGYNEDGTNIEMCNFALENVSNKGEFLNIIYEGIFSITQLNNYVTDEIRIKMNNYILNNRNDKVNMDSREFEKYFDVYTNSNILAMEILTHDVMQELVNFYNKYKIKFEIVIKNNKIYIRFNTGVMFEPNILKSSNDMTTLWVYFNVLQFVTNLTVKINKLLKDLDI